MTSEWLTTHTSAKKLPLRSSCYYTPKKIKLVPWEHAVCFQQYDIQADIPNFASSSQPTNPRK